VNWRPKLEIGKSYFVRKRLPALIWAILIFIASSVPRVPELKIGIKHTDKIIHFVEFGIFGVLLLLFFSRDGKLTKGNVAISFLAGVIWAVLDEYHQSFVPGRDPSIFDLTADVIGIFFFQFVFLLKKEALS